MAQINPYLNFPGNTEAAFNFYQSVFGGQFAMVMRFGDTPEKEKMPEIYHSKMMHIALPIGENILMGTDALEGFGPALTKGNNTSLSLSATSLEEGQRLFSGLSEGGTVTMPFSQQFWGDTFGMFTDKFGIQWMVSFNEKYQSGEKATTASETTAAPSASKIEKVVNITASRENVWTVLTEDFYTRQWLAEFSEGSYADTEGWQEGNKVVYLDHTKNGMIAKVVSCQPQEQLTIEMTGQLKDGEEDYDSAEVKSFQGGREVYTLSDNQGLTHLAITSDMAPEMMEGMGLAWDRAVEKIRMLAEMRQVQ